MSVENKLFSSVKYILTGEISEEVKLLLRHNGAEGFSYFSDYLTHCIVGDDPCEIDVTDAVELYEIPAVTQEWVTYSHKCNKLLPSAFKGGCTLLFTGVVASFSKLSPADMKKLWAMLKYYGGTHSSAFKNTTTHLIVSKAEGRMYQQALKCPGKVHVVTPDWLVDSIRAGRLLDVDSYHPRLLLEKPLSHSESQCAQTTSPLMQPWEPDAESNYRVIPSSKPLKEPEHAQPKEFDREYNSTFLNYLMSKTRQEPVKEQPLESAVESNGVGTVKTGKIDRAKESKQEFKPYSAFLKSRLSALSDIGNQAMESSCGKLTFLSPKSDTNGMNSQPSKMKEFIPPKTTKRKILNGLDENQVLIQKQRTHHQTKSCDGMIQPQVLHSQQKFHKPDGPQKKSVRRDERSKRKSTLETSQKNKLQLKGILKKPPKLKGQSEKLSTCKISQQKAMQKMLRKPQEKTHTRSQSLQDKPLQANIHKSKVIQPEIPKNMLIQSRSKKVRFNLPKTPPKEEQASRQKNTQQLRLLQKNTQPPGFLQPNTQTPGLLQTNTQPPGLLQTNTQITGFLQTNTQPAEFLQTNNQPLGFLQTNTHPVGFIQTNNQPLGFLQTNPQPVVFFQTNNQLSGFLQTNTRLLGLLGTNIQPLVLLQTNTQPLGFYQPCDSNPSLPSASSQVMLVPRHLRETLLNTITNQQPTNQEMPQAHSRPPAANGSPPLVLQTDLPPAGRGAERAPPQ